MKNKNIFYFSKISKIGGIENFFYELSKKYKQSDVLIVYKYADKKQLERLKQNFHCIKYNEDLELECEKAFFNFNTDIIEKVKAKEYILIVHGDYKTLEAPPPQHPKITKYIGVSKTCCDSFKELTGIECELCYNPITIDCPKVLNLVSATRLTKEKGKHRMERLANILDKAKIPYLWTVFTDDENAISNPNIIYASPRLDIRGFIAKADYLIQLSDNLEGYCYSVIEALMLNTPVIATKCNVFEELGIKDGIHGFLLDFDLSNADAQKIYESNLKFDFVPPKDGWKDLLCKGKTQYVNYQNKLFTVESLKTYEELGVIDSELGRIPKAGEKWEVTGKRLDELTNENILNRTFVRRVTK